MVIEGDPTSPQGGVIAHKYIEVLEEYLPTILNPNSIFMQDGVGIYRAHLVRDWFVEQDIELMDWPLYFLDLNPIKNL